jgi:hypothetical protein
MGVTVPEEIGKPRSSPVVSKNKKEDHSSSEGSGERKLK